jgi:hypothetical protein
MRMKNGSFTFIALFCSVFGLALGFSLALLSLPQVREELSKILETYKLEKKV